MTEAALPRPSATLLLLRDGSAGLETFMVVRHHEIDFASGALVLPGGRMEPADSELAVAALHSPSRDGRPSGRPMERGGAVSDHALQADPLAPLKIAAIRESFEECGVLIARPRGENGLISAARAAALDRSAPFAALIAREALVPAIDLLVLFAHWITPAFLPKRFDTHFFLAIAPPGQALAHDGREAVDSVWISPRAALAEHGKRFRLLFPTERNLWKLSAYSDADSALAAARARPVVTVLPERIEVDGGPGLKIPAEAGYGGEAFPVPEFAATPLPGGPGAEGAV
jgi:8-oxo-dGTP pyrophosphatase MutT (NUDIX family)